MGALSALLCLVWTSAASGSAPPAPASIWRAEEWTDVSGRRWTSGDLEGRVVLLDFWATWCPPCLAEMPRLRRLDERFGDRGLVVLGVALDTLERRRLRAFLLRHDVAWPQVHAPRGVGADIARRFAVEGVPVTFLVDRRGRIVARDLRGRALEAAVEALLGVGAGTSAPDPLPEPVPGRDLTPSDAPRRTSP